MYFLAGKEFAQTISAFFKLNLLKKLPNVSFPEFLSE